MYFYVVGRTILALNALSGAAYHYELFGENYNPGVFLYAGSLTFYILGEDFLVLSIALVSGYFTKSLGVDLFLPSSSRCSSSVNVLTMRTVTRNTAPKSGRSIKHG